MTRGSDCASAARALHELAAVVEHDDAVGQRGDQAHVVLDDDDGDVVLGAQAPDGGDQLLHLGVRQTRGGLVEQQQLAASSSSARHSSMPLCRPCESSSAGRSRRPAEAVPLEQRERLGAQLPLGRAGARQPQRPLHRPTGQPGVGAEQHVLEHRLVQLQRRMLERARQAVTGERRRARAADLGVVDPHRALLMKPKLLLLDEPAAGLPHAEVKTLIATVRRLRADDDITVVIVEHHMGLIAALTDRVVVLDHGAKLIEEDGRRGAVRRPRHRGLHPGRMPRMTLLELEDVTAFYGPVQVLDGVSLNVPENGAVGILGANERRSDHPPRDQRHGPRPPRRRRRCRSR